MVFDLAQYLMANSVPIVEIKVIFSGHKMRSLPHYLDLSAGAIPWFGDLAALGAPDHLPFSLLMLFFGCGFLSDAVLNGNATPVTVTTGVNLNKSGGLI
jgi:hypothetical protein